ncbi:tryptophan-rich sensory protein, partial [bacterium]|nr:tryptophan-rich sensory protein [bacterium]
MTANDLLNLVLCVGLCFLAAAIGGWVTARSVHDWYATLQKPAWNPPGSWFSPVWVVLYTLMGLSLWLVWRQGGFAAAPLALTLFAVQLILNVLWSWLFFGAHRPGLAFVEIVVLWIAILATTLTFWRVSVLAGA